MSATHFLDGGGDMAAAIRAFDWTRTSLGPLESWPTPLKTAVGMMVASKFPKCIVWGPDLVTIYNDAFAPILGDKPSPLGRPLNAVWSEVWSEIGPIVAKAYAGEATFIEDFPLVINRSGYPEQAWFTFCYSPIRDETGRVAGMIDTVIETTGKMLSERNARLLNAELAHRIKNTLAMVTAIANQTFRAAATKEDAQTIFARRIAALGHAHSILTQTSWSGAPIRAVVDGTLSPHREAGRIAIDGPPIELSAKQSLSLALALNELATNAIKYGALSTPAGRVDLSWSFGAPGSNEAFRLEWIEANGPPVTPPARRGFGSRLIERALAADFGGEATLDYRPEGLRFVLTTRMANLKLVEEAA